MLGKNPEVRGPRKELKKGQFKAEGKGKKPPREAFLGRIERGSPCVPSVRGFVMGVDQSGTRVTSNAKCVTIKIPERRKGKSDERNR